MDRLGVGPGESAVPMVGDAPETQEVDFSALGVF